MALVSPPDLDLVRQKVEQGERLEPAELQLLQDAADMDRGPALRLALAHAYINADDERTALALLELLVRDFPLDVQVRLGQARALAGLERYGQAEQVLNDVLTLNPDDPEALKALAVLALRRGETRRARQWVAEVLRIDPIDDEARLLREELDAFEAASSSRPTSAAPEREFVQALLAQLRAREVPHARRGSDLLLPAQGGGMARVGLDSLYATYAHGGRPLAEAAEATAQELASLSLGIPRDKAELLAAVLPVLRTTSFHPSATGSACREGPAGLLVYYVIEDPELVRYLPGWVLDGSTGTLEELDAAAWENLTERVAAPEPVRVDEGKLARAQGRTALWALASGDGHDGARLLTAAQRETLAAQLGPGPYRVSLGHRELALVCREAEVEAVAMLEALAPAPDGIPGRFRLDADGKLSLLG